MVTFQKAREAVLSSLKQVASEKIKISESLGRTLASDIFSPISVPAYDNSAMDGYAVRCADVKKIPAVLKIVEKIPAGKTPTKKILPGSCSQIMTGAVLPSGADCVVMVENTQKEGEDFIRILKKPKKWENVRFAGEDIKKGALVVGRGRVITPSVMGVLTSLGMSYVNVYQKVKVGYITSGDEVIMPPHKIKKGQIYNSNYSSLYGAIISAGAIPVYFGHCKDDILQVIRTIKSALPKIDILLTSGGVSMGDYDVFKEAFRRLGAWIIFEKINIKPARPTVFAKFSDKIIFGLPGNPVSTLTAFELFVKPAIMTMSGRSFSQEKISALAEFEYLKDDKRMHFLRGFLRRRNGKYYVRLTSKNQGSAILTSLVKANCFVLVPEGKSKIAHHDLVEVLVTHQL